MDSLIENEHSNAEFARAINCPGEQFVFLECHRPKEFSLPYHVHASVEVNYLDDCDMIYSFSGTEVELKRGRICVFWAAYPHRAVSVNENGLMTNAYISLSEFLRWQMPSDFVDQILGGAVLCSKIEMPSDRLLTEKWGQEIEKTSLDWQRQHSMEIQCRLNRLAIEGWETLLPANRTSSKKMIGGKAVMQFDQMLRFITLNFSDRISIDDVARAGGISTNYALSLFRKILGSTIKEKITDIRIFHAKMLLTDTNQKIVTIAMDCGFGSLSAFYDTFQQKMGVSPAAFRKSYNAQHSR